MLHPTSDLGLYIQEGKPTHCRVDKTTVCRYYPAMATTLESPGFVTHHELDRSVGTNRTRQRWQRRGLLPPLHWIRADRSRLGLLPEFVLGSVIVGESKSGDDSTVLERTCKVAEEVCETQSFREISRAAQEVLSETEGRQGHVWDLGRFVDRLASIASPALAEWRSAVNKAEAGLARHGLAVSCRPAEVGGVDGHECLVSVTGSAIRLRFPLDELSWVPEQGEPVIVDRVEVGIRRRDYLFPALALEKVVPGPPLVLPTDGELAQREGGTMVSTDSRLSRRFASIAGRRGPLTSVFATRRGVEWREQFERGYLGLDVGGEDGGNRGTAASSKGVVTEILSRPLKRPAFH
jgi:hypothetical protein